jgi:hypothetical protein
MHRYRVSVDVNVFSHAENLNCQCGALLGAAPGTSSLPASVTINEVEIEVYGYDAGSGEWEYEYEPPEFENEPFELDDDLEGDLEAMDGAIEAEAGGAFAREFEPFALPTLGPGQKYRMTFNLVVAEEDVPSIVNVPIQFAAGSNSEIHPVQFFEGYHDTLTLPTLWPSDLDADGDTDGEDLSAWGAAFGASAAGDIDGDGATTGSDLLVWQRQVGNLPVAGPLPSGAATTAAVPEPSAFLLALGGLALNWALRRR